jgi:hypothetical protein
MGDADFDCLKILSITPITMEKSNPNASVQQAMDIPDGYALVKLEDGRMCIVPEYLVPGTHQAFDQYRSCHSKDAGNKEGGVSFVQLC